MTTGLLFNPSRSKNFRSENNTSSSSIRKKIYKGYTGLDSEGVFLNSKSHAELVELMKCTRLFYNKKQNRKQAEDTKLS